jgi:hypothetical protein
MLAELNEPAKADVISESIAFSFTKSEFSARRLSVFSKEELAAISIFFGECARRYKPPYRRSYLEAQSAVESQLLKD